MGAPMSNEFKKAVGTAFLTLVLALSSCSVQFNGRGHAPPARAGTTFVQPKEPRVWSVPCSVGTGTRFTARLDGAVGTGSSRPGDPFSARVLTPVVSSCQLDFIPVGGVLRGRVARAEPGDPPVLALELIDVETSLGPLEILAAVRSGGGFAWLETNSPNARSSYRAFVLYPAWVMEPSRETSPESEFNVTLPAGSVIELELLQSVDVLP
jgi:hypothetical protein